MAEADWGSVEAPETRPASGRATGMLSWAGAIVSLALIAGLAVWGYKLAVRDVSGVPVVRALEGPMRVQPDDPGGEAAANQGLSVNDVQADGQAGAPADRLTLAPQPVELTAEDTPADPSAQASALVTDIAPTAEANEVAAATDQAVAVALSEDTSPADPVAAALAMADAIADGVEPLSEAPEPALPANPDLVAASVPGVAVSPRPTPRPATRAVPAASVAATAPDAATASDAGTVPETVREVAADTIPVGTRLVQLGAFENAEIARTEWNKLSVRFEDYMEDKARVIEKASSGGKTFYRLRALGFDDLSDARRFCSVLIAGKSACIPVATR